MGKLEQAVTRGNGEIGEDVTHNARVFRNVPLSIPFQGGAGAARRGGSFLTVNFTASMRSWARRSSIKIPVTFAAARCGS